MRSFAVWRMPKRPRDGPSAQLLADGTPSIQGEVSFLASVAQYSLMSQALSLVLLEPLVRLYMAAALSM